MTLGNAWFKLRLWVPSLALIGTVAWEGNHTVKHGSSYYKTGVPVVTVGKWIMHKGQTRIPGWAVELN